MIKTISAALLLLLNAFSAFAFQDKVAFYVGSQDKDPQASITLAELDLSTGGITVVDTFSHGAGPGYLAISPNRKNLYAVSSENKLMSFSIGTDKKLTFLNSQSSEGENPCHVAVHPSGKMVLASNYTGGSFTAYPVEAGGKLGAPIYKEQYSGTGPNTRRQEKSHAHFSAATPDGRFVFVTDLGGDKIMNYAADAKSGKLMPNPAQPFFMAKPGSGPRHFVLSASGKELYLLNELEATLTTCSVDKNGVIKALNTYPTIPADFSGTNTSAAVHLHPNGKFVYVSNRGHNSISAFRIKGGGVLEKTDEQTQNISTPRDFNIDPSGKWMIVGNQTGDNLVVYAVDPQTGKLTFKQEGVKVKLPICIVF
ncbi:lactonase family protein [Dyadobacter sandarakinus]|uniref:Lactonase family protein n=1 Tax=Dyadobacter sandarakinus TaxID=2747268 RepID=A0ABX7IAB9_9BACT|nr:lactonase family protein [Dyadobacter sandarakinus]QRR02073.1 lactonase family protein [Dyadobacter sandarakinus]